MFMLHKNEAQGLWDFILWNASLKDFRTCMLVEVHDVCGGSAWFLLIILFLRPGPLEKLA